MQEKVKRTFRLSEADLRLFADMKHAFRSLAEKNFFHKLEEKEQYEPAFANELLVYERDNHDGIYLIRKYYDVYLIGCQKADGSVAEYECDTLSELLQTNLSQCIAFPRQITVLEWLRESDYSFVRYNRNYDND